MKNENQIKTGRRGFFKKFIGAAIGGAVLSGSANTLASGKWNKIDSKGHKDSPTGDFDSPFLGTIGIVAFNFAPRGYSSCNGQILSINANQALFALLGTMYGGNGVQTFALPNLQGRSPIHWGTGFDQGDTGGEINHTLNISEMPEHTHSTGYSANYGTSDSPVGFTPAKNASSVPQYSNSLSSIMGLGTYIGGNQPHYNMPPYTVLNFIIATQGIFPSRN